MATLVTAKRAADYIVKVSVEVANVKASLKSFDTVAVNETVRLREEGQAT